MNKVVGILRHSSKLCHLGHFIWSLQTSYGWTHMLSWRHNKNPGHNKAFHFIITIWAVLLNYRHKLNGYGCNRHLDIWTGMDRCDTDSWTDAHHFCNRPCLTDTTRVYNINDVDNKPLESFEHACFFLDHRTKTYLWSTLSCTLAWEKNTFGCDM